MNTRYTIVAILFSLVACGVGCGDKERQTTNRTSQRAIPRPYQEWIDGLAETNSTDGVRQSLNILSDAKQHAFDDLLANLSNAVPAKRNFFQEESGYLGTDGVLRLSVPTIGNACFGIFHRQVEGNWPKAYRQMYQLNETNALIWWSIHRTNELHALQVGLAERALFQAKRKEWSDGVTFCEHNLREKQKEEPNWGPVTD